MSLLLKFLPDFLIKLLGLGEQIAENKSQTIPMREDAIREKADTKVINEILKQDKKLDKELWREPKICYEFDDPVEFRKCWEDKSHVGLYYGNKEDILILINRDSANALHRKQQKELRKQVKNSKGFFFVIKIHPLTIHK